MRVGALLTMFGSIVITILLPVRSFHRSDVNSGLVEREVSYARDYAGDHCRDMDPGYPGEGHSILGPACASTCNSLIDLLLADKLR